MKPDEILFKVYKLNQIIAPYMKIEGNIRKTFLVKLIKDNIITEEKIDKDTNDFFEHHKEYNPSDDMKKDYKDMLIDYYFVSNFSSDLIDSYLNLARKFSKIKALARAVTRESNSSKDIKKALDEFCKIPAGDVFLPLNETNEIRVKLIHRFISNQLPYIGIAKNFINVRDIGKLMEDFYGSTSKAGRIGGKAAGITLAHKIILPSIGEHDEELAKYVTVPESFYFNSEIFNDFIDYHNFHYFHSQKYKSNEDLRSDFATITKSIIEAEMPPSQVKMIKAFLEKIGDESPLILRSSTLLEDNMGYSFSGKYDSIFISNQGKIKDRVEEFIKAFKLVHISTFALAPIIYRKDHDLLDFDEKMNVLVQKVVGTKCGDYFLPAAAGVAFSYNGYRWNPKIKKEEGLLRLVYGLGTRAVDRVGNDYPRMISLSHPNLRPEISPSQIYKYSQKTVDVINLITKDLESIPLLDLIDEVKLPGLYNALAYNNDGQMTAPMFKTEQLSSEGACITFDNLISKTPFIRIMKKILKKLELAYKKPVDVEFAWHNDKLYILQCRPLNIKTSNEKVNLPENVTEAETLFTNGKCMTSAKIENIEYIVYIDPKSYNLLETHQSKVEIGQAVNVINRKLEEKRFALLGPGRWGSSDISLGVRVGYNDINNTLILGEIAFEKGGSTPEVSFGTHFFNDLVEANIISIALYPDDKKTQFNEPYFLKSKNLIEQIAPSISHLKNIIHIIDVKQSSGGKLLHVYQDDENQKGIAYFADA